MSAMTQTGNDAGAAPTETLIPLTADTIQLDGRVLGTVAGPWLGAQFEYTEADGLVHVRYSGGHVRLGYRVGTRTGNHLAFRYAELSVTGDSSSGRVDARLELLADGRIRIRELWSVDSRRGEGASIAEELT